MIFVVILLSFVMHPLWWDLALAECVSVSTFSKKEIWLPTLNTLYDLIRLLVYELQLNVDSIFALLMLTFELCEVVSSSNAHTPLWLRGSWRCLLNTDEADFLALGALLPRLFADMHCAGFIEAS